MSTSSGMNPWYRFCLELTGGYMSIFMRPEITGLEHVPPEGGLIVVANHVSYWDPPLAAWAVQREVHFVAKEELFRVPLFGPLIRSLNAFSVRRGVVDRSTIRRATKALERGHGLLIFPEGTRSKSGHLSRARPGVGLMWSHTRVPILPAFLEGTNRVRHWLAGRQKVRFRFGPVLGEKELLRGEPLEPSREQYQRIADRTMEAIAAIGGVPWNAASASRARPHPSGGQSNEPGGSTES